MKKTLSILFLFSFILVSIFADSYKSNLLMQILPDSSDSLYLLVVNGNKEELYYENELIKVRTTEYTNDFDGCIKVVLVDDIKSGKSEGYKYFNNYLIHYSLTDLVSSYEINYNYKDGLLVFTSSNNSVSYYIRDSISNALVGKKNIDSSYSWNGDNYLVENDVLLTQISPSIFLQDDFIVDGDFIYYTSNNILYTYSLDGILLCQEDDFSKTDYEYVDGVLYKSTTKKDNTELVNYYTNGSLDISELYVDGALSEVSSYLNTGMVKILYSDCRAVAEIKYDSNNMKILSVRYLN